MKILLKIFAVLLLLFVLLIAVLLFLPDQQYQQIAKRLLETATDREVTIGELITTRSLNPTLEIKDFKLSNADWTDRGQMISAANLFISVDFLQLAEGKLLINSLSAEDLNIDLLKNEKGEANWQFKKRKADSGKKFDEQILTRIILSEFDLSDTQLSYVDQQKKLKYRLELPGLQLIEDTQKPDLQRINAKGVFNDLPFTIDGEAGLIDSLAKNKSLPFNLVSRLNESDLTIKGQVVDQSGGLHLSTSVIAHTSSLTDLSVFTNNKLPPIGPIHISADIAGNLKAITQEGIDVGNLHINVDDPTVSLDVHGSLSELGAANTGDVSISLDISELSKISQLFGLKKELPGSVSVHASASGSGKDFGLKISRATLESTFLNARISGQVEDLFNTRDTNIDINANAPNLDFITQLFGRKMPPQWGPVEASAILTGINGKYGLADIVAELRGASTLNATGSIESLIKFDGMDLDVEASLATLNEISAFTRSPLPDLGPITAQAKINWREGKLSLNEGQANYKGQYGNADVTGSIGDLIRFDIVRLKADANVPDLAVFELFSGVKMPDFKGLRATADLVSPTARDLSAKNLTASYDSGGVRVSASGSIDSMIKKRAELNLDLEGSLDSLGSINPVFKTSLPDIGPIAATAKLSGAKKDIQLNTLEVLLSDSVLSGTLKGDLGKLADFKGINLDVDLSTPAINQLLNRMNIQSNVKKPAKLISRINYEAGTFNFQKSELDLAGGKIIGQLSLVNYLARDVRPKITGKINVLNFNLRDFSEDDKSKPEQQNKEKLLSKKTLPYEFIEKTDLDMEINIGRLTGNIFDVANTTFVIRSTDGLFQLGPFNGKLSGGDVDLELYIDAKNRPSRTKLLIDVQGFDMARAGVFRDSDRIESKGDALFKLNLDAKGRTLASIMASANGGGALYFEDLLIKKGGLDLFTSNLLKKTLNAVNPFKKKEKDTQISCAAFAFKIDDGLLTTPFGIAAEATDYSVTGDAWVDFKTEAIDLEFKTKVKKLLAINPLEKLTGLVQVVGELSAPEVTFNPKGILNIGATVGAAIATGGLSFWAQDQLEKMNAKSGVCSKALGKAG